MSNLLLNEQQRPLLSECRQDSGIVLLCIFIEFVSFKIYSSWIRRRVVMEDRNSRPKLDDNVRVQINFIINKSEFGHFY